MCCSVLFGGAHTILNTPAPLCHDCSFYILYLFPHFTFTMFFPALLPASASLCRTGWSLIGVPPACREDALTFEEPTLGGGGDAPMYKLCGASTAPPDFISTGTKCTIRFKTGAGPSQGRRGFRFRFWGVRDDKVDKVSIRTTYTIKSGDTLGKISKLYDTSPEALELWNGIEDPRLIEPGEVLTVARRFDPESPLTPKSILRGTEHTKRKASSVFSRLTKKRVKPDMKPYTGTRGKREKAQRVAVTRGAAKKALPPMAKPLRQGTTNDDANAMLMEALRAAHK